jgi:lipopolysaccharide export system permease protein
LFGMILLSTIFTIGINRDYNTMMYLFFGLVLGFLLYFLNDLSIAVGLANKVPLAVSVWSPIMIIVFLSTINLLKINEK